MRWYLLLLFSISLLHSAQGLTLEQAMLKLREQNIELSLAEFDEKIASLEEQIANAASFGSLDIAQSITRSNEALNVFGFKLQSREVSSADFMPSSSLNFPQSRNHFDTALVYSLPLYSGGKITTHQKITQALKELKGLEKEQRIAQKIFELKKTFYTLSLLEFHQAQLKRVLVNIETMHARSEALLNEGYVKKVDVMEVETRKNAIERLFHQTKASHAILLNYVSFLLNEEVNAIVPISESLVFTQAIKSQILEQNVDIQKALKALEITKLSTTLGESAFLPTVGIMARYGSANDKWLKEFSTNEYYTLGLMVRWNIFNGGADSASLEQSRVAYLKAKQNVTLAQKSTLLQLEKLSIEIGHDSFEIESLQQELALAEAIYKNYEQRYSEKLVAIHEVLSKQSEAISVRLRLHEFQNRRNEKIFEYEMIHSKELP